MSWLSDQNGSPEEYAEPPRENLDERIPRMRNDQTPFGWADLDENTCRAK